MSTPQKNQPLRSAKQSLAVLANAFSRLEAAAYLPSMERFS